MHKFFNTAIAIRKGELKKGEKGFTLIELLVVVIIIGILAAIAIPVFLNQREAAWRASVESDLRNAALVVETYGTTNSGSFTGADLTAPPAFISTVGNTITLTVANSTEYTILGYNENIAPGTQTYDNDGGGLLPWNPAGIQP